MGSTAHSSGQSIGVIPAPSRSTGGLLGCPASEASGAGSSHGGSSARSNPSRGSGIGPPPIAAPEADCGSATRCDDLGEADDACLVERQSARRVRHPRPREHERGVRGRDPEGSGRSARQGSSRPVRHSLPVGLEVEEGGDPGQRRGVADPGGKTLALSGRADERATSTPLAARSSDMTATLRYSRPRCPGTFSAPFAISPCQA